MYKHITVTVFALRAGWDVRDNPRWNKCQLETRIRTRSRLPKLGCRMFLPLLTLFKHTAMFIWNLTPSPSHMAEEEGEREIPIITGGNYNPWVIQSTNFHHLHTVCPTMHLCKKAKHFLTIDLGIKPQSNLTNKSSFRNPDLFLRDRWHLKAEQTTALQ